MLLADVHVGERCVYFLSQSAKYSKATRNPVTLQQLMDKTWSYTVYSQQPKML